MRLGKICEQGKRSPSVSPRSHNSLPGASGKEKAPNPGKELAGLESAKAIRAQWKTRVSLHGSCELRRDDEHAKKILNRRWAAAT
jgi:hypothetical protein